MPTLSKIPCEAMSKIWKEYIFNDTIGLIIEQKKDEIQQQQQKNQRKIMFKNCAKVLILKYNTKIENTKKNIFK